MWPTLYGAFLQTSHKGHTIEANASISTQMSRGAHFGYLYLTVV